MLSLFHYDFVQNAFLAGSLVAIVSGFVGYFVVLRGQTFASEALSHVGFAGAVGAAVLGASSLVGMLLLTLLAALGMGALGKRLRGRDIEIGMVLSFVLGLGVLSLSIYTQNATEAVSVLFGSILSVTRQDVLITLGCSLLVSLVLLVLFRPLLFASIDPEVAEARGIPVQRLSVFFLLLLALSVSQAVQVVGVLLVFTLLVMPAAAAEYFTPRPALAILVSICISLVCTWGGLVLAFIGHAPVSFYIVSLASLFYAAARLYNRLHAAPPRHHAVPHHGREVSGS